jgi:hypothetical protein
VNSGSIGTSGHLTWLSSQVSSGAVADETTEQVTGGTYKAPLCC